MDSRVLVIGDFILDHDVFCDVVGLSLETPTLKGTFSNERFLYGGAANVVEHLLALGSPVAFLTGVAVDNYTETVLNFGKHPSLDLRPLNYEGQNLIKSRYWAKRGSKVYKYFQLNRGSKADNSQLLSAMDKMSLESFDKAVLVDYGNGMFSSADHTQKIISKLRENNISVFSSCQKSSRDITYEPFRGSDLICMNDYEALSAAKLLSLSDIGMLSKHLESDLCVTSGPKGSTYHSGNETVSYKALQVDCVDSCGAGDAFLAAMVLKEDCVFANKWAALSVTKQGTEVPTLEDLDEL